jgi:hypothetical protein
MNLRQYILRSRNQKQTKIAGILLYKIEGSNRLSTYIYPDDGLLGKSDTVQLSHYPHAIIGELFNGTVATIQIKHWDAYNGNDEGFIEIGVCNGLYYAEALEICKYLIKMFKIPVDKVILQDLNFENFYKELVE